MANKKKPKTPPPPRRVQAPKPRQDKPRVAMDDMGGRHRAMLYGVAGLGVIALIAVVLLVTLGGGSASAKNVPPLMTTAGCNFKTVTAYVPPGQGVHVPSLTKKFPWNTDPPSNGQHYPAWAVWGFYTEPVNPRMVVHNEEHGGVVLWWGIEGLAADSRPAPRLLRREDRRLVRHAVPQARQQGRDQRVDGRPGEVRPERLLRPGASRDLPALRRGDQEGLRGVPQRVHREGPGRGSALVRQARHGPAVDFVAAPGWRNWSDAPGLKPGVPVGTWGFDSLPRHSR